MVNYVEFVNMMCAHPKPAPHHRSPPTHPPTRSLVLGRNNHQKVPTSEPPRRTWQDRIMMAERHVVWTSFVCYVL
jgi:hypothetical protein